MGMTHVSREGSQPTTSVRQDDFHDGSISITMRANRNSVASEYLESANIAH